MDKIVNLFAVKNTGFMVVSRSAFATLLKMIQSHNWVSIYGYLLFCAQFGIGHTSTGQEQAMEYIETYSETLPKPEHAKLACNYLRDKTYKG